MFYNKIFIIKKYNNYYLVNTIIDHNEKIKTQIHTGKKYIENLLNQAKDIKMSPSEKFFFQVPACFLG